MTRLFYFFSTLGIVAASFGALSLFTEPQAAIAIIVICQLLIVVSRMENVGLSLWWAIGVFIPLVCLYPAFICTFAPTGYKIKSSPNYNIADGWYKFGFVLYILVAVVYFMVLVGG